MFRAWVLGFSGVSGYLLEGHPNGALAVVHRVHLLEWGCRSFQGLGFRGRVQGFQCSGFRV